MNNLVIEIIEENKKIETSGFINHKVVTLRIDVKIILTNRLDNYKDFSSNTYGECKRVNVYDKNKKYYYKDCILLTPDGVNFIGHCREVRLD